MLGAALAWLPFELLADDPGGWGSLAIGVGGAVLAVAIATTVLVELERPRARGVAHATVEELIGAGEGERVEIEGRPPAGTLAGARRTRGWGTWSS